MTFAMNEAERKDRPKRERYLRGLADDYGVDYETVEILADMLGPNEDYDGLVSALEDIEYFGWEA